MRLVCPNCGAQYEVDDAVIPPNGRDVQCSNCAHSWFQPSKAMLDAEAATPEPDPVPEDWDAEERESAADTPVADATAPEPEPERCRPELETRHTETETANAISQLYTAYFDRAPDDDGFDYWTALAADGLSHEEISGYFALSAEFEETYGEQTDDDFTNLVYNNVLCRDADTTGLAYWMDLLSNDMISRADLMLYFSQSVEFRTTITS